MTRRQGPSLLVLPVALSLLAFKGALCAPSSPQEAAPGGASPGNKESNTGGTAPPAAGAPAKKGIEIQISLQDAILWAVRKNLDILAEDLNSDIARRELVIARATFDPFFNVGTTYTKNREPSVSRIDVGSVVGVAVSPSDVLTFRSGIRGLSPIGTTYQVSLIENRFNNPTRVTSGFQTLNPLYSTRIEVAASQPLLKNAWFPFNLAQIRQAKNNIEISREQLEFTAINTVFSVEGSYWEVVFTIKNFEAKKKALELTEEQLRIDQKKVEVGTKAKIDLTTTESQLARRKTEYDQAAQLLENARDKLLQIMNYIGPEESLKGLWEKPGVERPYKKYSDITVIPTTEPSSAPITPDRSESIRKAFENRVEFRQIELQIQNQDISVAVAKNQLLPSFDITGTWAQLGLDTAVGDSFDSLTSGEYYDWSVGAVFEVPLSLRGPRAQYRNARDLRQRLAVDKQNLENSIVLEVDKAIRDLDFSHRAVVNLEKQTELQRDLLRAERVKLEVGKSIAYTVAEIENDLVSAIAQELRAKADFQLSKLNYERAVGELLKNRGVVLKD